MFERRLRTVALLLAFLVLLIAGRLMQVQVFGREHYQKEARKALTRSRPIETTRGPILDVRGRVLAEDRACIDAAVDYRAVTRDLDQKLVNDWVSDLALERLRNRPDGSYRAASSEARKAMRAAEEERVREAIAAMWPRLAELSGKSVEEIENVRSEIDHKVKIGKRRLLYRRYEAAVNESSSRPAPPWYQRWLISGGDEVPTEEEFDETTIEQLSPHVVLRNVPPHVQNELGTNPDRYPGLILRPSANRVYPFGAQAAHAIGYLRKVTKKDLENDGYGRDDLRAYRPLDLIGENGVESLAEQALRGVRGQESVVGTESGLTETRRTNPSPGRAVTTTIDVELQAEIREAFQRAQIPHPDRTVEAVREGVVHGAAVVIDVPTGEVRALVSYPDFDLNDSDAIRMVLPLDERNKPMWNRATRSAYEPGSTVKPLVGIAAIAAGKARLDERIECTGYLFLRGRQWANGRCWTATSFDVVYPHHSIPGGDPHRGPTPDLDGHLNLTDAVQRSCNIYFENMADRLGAEGLSQWFERFGLGRPTGIGLPESAGRLPRQFPKGPMQTSATWSAGMGQRSVLATPLQIANAMATIARDGVWMRPRLVRDPDVATPAQAGADPLPDRVDLGLPRDAVQAAKRGMGLVVSSAAGTGGAVRFGDLAVAAKTGTAQAAPFTLPMTDADGKLVLDDKGNRIWVKQRPGTWDNPNRDLPWYRASDAAGDKLNHAWLVGFAPADNPTIAFAVMVEYGGGGGGTIAGPLARRLLEACVNHGYVPTRKGPTDSSARAR